MTWGNMISDHMTWHEVTWYQMIWKPAGISIMVSEPFFHRFVSLFHFHASNHYFFSQIFSLHSSLITHQRNLVSENGHRENNQQNGNSKKNSDTDDLFSAEKTKQTGYVPPLIDSHSVPQNKFLFNEEKPTGISEGWLEKKKSSKMFSMGAEWQRRWLYSPLNFILLCHVVSCSVMSSRSSLFRVVLLCDDDTFMLLCGMVHFNDDVSSALVWCGMV